MRRPGWFACGAVSAITIEALVAAVVLTRAHGFSAREEPGTVEAWVARKARKFALPTDARARTNPIANTPEVLAAARAHWADHCAGCHANDGSGAGTMGTRMYPPAPDMRGAATQNLTDGELFFTIENGIRHTGMPAWGGSEHSEEDSWKLVHFIRHLPALTSEERTAMAKLNPKGPDDRAEEQWEEQFLKGESTDAPIPNHHH